MKEYKCILLLILFSFFLSHKFLFAQDEYRYERSFPITGNTRVLSEPLGMAFDSTGCMYVSDMLDRIQKFSSDGKLISQWGKNGKEDGDFNIPYGIATDKNDFIYITDSQNSRVQIFDSNGKFISKWKSDGNSEFQFKEPAGIAADTNGNIWVADAGLNSIQKFDSTGKLLSVWNADKGFNFNSPHGIVWDKNGFLYVADSLNNRILKYNEAGEQIRQWGSPGSGNGEFDTPLGVAADFHGDIYVTDMGNHRIQKFDSNGMFKASFGTEGFGNGEFFAPEAIIIPDDRFVYIADRLNDRIQKLTTDGIFMSKFGRGNGPGFLNSPVGLAVDLQENIFVADTENHLIQKYDKNGKYLQNWGGEGSENGKFSWPYGIAVDQNGDIYVSDNGNCRIQKYDSKLGEWKEFGKAIVSPWGIALTLDAIFVADNFKSRILKFFKNGQQDIAWGSNGEIKENMLDPRGLDIDKEGNIYVADKSADCVLKFSSEGIFLNRFANQSSPGSVTLDDEGHIYVSSTENRILKFDKNGMLQAEFGEGGSYPAQFNSPQALGIGADGKIYVADRYNHRIQIFRKASSDDKKEKAIIVAGGGPYPGNRLWDATRVSANFAYRTLMYQGLQKSDICYLSSDAGIDLDNNGKSDDIEAISDSSTSAKDRLRDKIINWTSDADRLILYLVDHGGSKRFSLTESQILTDTELNVWLTEFQKNNEKQVIVIYDACRSGSFHPVLRQDARMPPAVCPGEIKPRIIISSAKDDQNAYFLNQGTISFSEFFWSEVFNGANLSAASQTAGNLIANITTAQTYQYSACGSLKEQNVTIGNGTEYLAEEGRAEIKISEIRAEQVKVTVTHTAEISRVWIVLIPENCEQTGKEISDSTIIELPSQDLLPGEEPGVYEGTLKLPQDNLSYQLVGCATDMYGNQFRSESVSVLDKAKKAHAMLIAGETDGENLPEEFTSKLKNYVQYNLNTAYAALIQQGYDDDSIYAMAPNDMEFAHTDSSFLTLDTIKSHLDTLNGDNTENLIIYITGTGEPGEFHLGSGETLTAAVLDNMLDEIQNRISVNLIFIYDADYSGGFLPFMQPPEGKNRVLISATSTDQKLPLVEGTDISFSGFFWKNIRNGLNLWRAFSEAEESLIFLGPSASPQLDDNGNGIGNEAADGNRAASITIGTGLGIVPNAMQFVFPETVEPDAFEPDNYREQAKVLTIDDTGEYRTLFPERDADWVKFYCLAGQTYTVSVKNQYGVPISDIRIQAFMGENESSAFAGAGEINIQNPADSVCYVKISSEDPGAYQYFLEIYISTAPELPVYVRGTVKNIFGNGIANAIIKSDRGGSAISLPGSGNYLMLHTACSALFTVNAVGYIENKVSVNITETTVYQLDIILQPVYQPPPDTMPLAEIISPASDNVRITEGESVHFQGNVTGGNEPFVYSWNFGGGAENVHVQSPIDVFFNKAGTYTVTFTVTDADGDTARDSLMITVNFHPDNIPVFPGPDGNGGDDIPICDFFSDPNPLPQPQNPGSDGNPGADIPIGAEPAEPYNGNTAEPETVPAISYVPEKSENTVITEQEKEQNIPSVPEKAEEELKTENDQSSASDDPDTAKNYRTPQAPESLGESGGMGCFIRSAGWQ